VSMTRPSATHAAPSYVGACNIDACRAVEEPAAAARPPAPAQSGGVLADPHRNRYFAVITEIAKTTMPRNAIPATSESAP
jgi:hypothetical protein